MTLLLRGRPAVSFPFFNVKVFWVFCASSSLGGALDRPEESDIADVGG